MTPLNISLCPFKLFFLPLSLFSLRFSTKHSLNTNKKGPKKGICCIINKLKFDLSFLRKVTSALHIKKKKKIPSKRDTNNYEEYLNTDIIFLILNFIRTNGLLFFVLVYCYVLYSRANNISRHMRHDKVNVLEPHLWD